MEHAQSPLSNEQCRDAAAAPFAPSQRPRAGVGAPCAHRPPGAAPAPEGER